ncbi:DUF4012 domain-containing protein [Candidatus Daviesbacteria bacterium]|nr:DUF4012 domain-containing protein [Candidatus Daviesbacteria bacterium]
MGEINVNSIENNRILVSRNTPIALVVGVAGFLGSYIAEILIESGIQVIGIDDFSTGQKINLEKVIRDKRFHLVNRSITERISIELPRLDYAIFAADNQNPHPLFTTGLANFLKFIKDFKPKVVLTSSILLYDNKVSADLKALKTAEIYFAKYSKYHKLNSRIVRLACLFGPRMHFRINDPVIRLIQASLLGSLHDETTSLDFGSRALYIEDAAKLVVKSIFSGSTAHKIYDGTNPQPIKVAEIKQILLDPVWYELKGFKPTELPPWSTPNLLRTIKELSWIPSVSLIQSLKRTIAYFKDNNIHVPEIEEDIWQKNVKKWTFNQPGEVLEQSQSEETDEEAKAASSDKRFTQKKDIRQGRVKRILTRLKSSLAYFVVLALIFYGLIFPIFQLGFGALNIRNNLKASALDISHGNFKGAEQKIQAALKSLGELKEITNSLAILKRLKLFNQEIEGMENILAIAEEGIRGVDHATRGTQSLYQASKIISGEVAEDPKPLYQKAQTELGIASLKIAKVKASLEDSSLLKSLPFGLDKRVRDLSTKLDFYSNLVEKATAASYLIPQITAVDGKKSYLVLLQNNLELRATGGFIGSYGRLDFQNGRIVNIKVDDIYNLDGQLKDVIEPPPEFKSDMGHNRLFLRDANFDPDFPTSARLAEFLYKKESSGEIVNGVIAMDLTASSKLISAVGGLDLSDYGEKINADNLFQKVISYAEVNFFPGSQAKRSFLIALQTQLFNKVFYLSKQNWPSIIQSLSDSLEQKHLLIYLSDQELFSYAIAQNWAGVMPRAVAASQGQTSDFLSTNESNMGANKSNYYLERKYSLETTVGKEGQISHKLTISYKNNSPSEAFPAGPYKNRFKIYLPLGAKIQKAVFGENDITTQMSSFSDFGRTGFSVLITLQPKEQKNLVLDYNLDKPTQFMNKENLYRLDVIKQPGTEKDPFEWTLTFPINITVESAQKNSSSFRPQEIHISTDLSKDRSFLVKFKQIN